MARICGICPVSHLIASSKACDADPGGRATADRGRPAPGDEPRPDRPVQRAQLLPPLIARPPVRVRRRPGEAQHHRRRAGQSAARPRRGRAFAGSGSRSSSGWAASGSIRRGSCPAASTRRSPKETRDRILSTIPEAIAAIERALAWYKSSLGPVGGRSGRVRRLPVGVHGPRRRRRQTSTTTTAGCGSWTPTGELLADRIDPRGYQDYLGEAVEPWSYLKSTYWKTLGYPEGVYRVGPLARVIVAGTDGHAPG